MKKIYQTLGVMSVTFLLASCSNNTQNGSEDTVNSDEVVEQWMKVQSQQQIR